MAGRPLHRLRNPAPLPSFSVLDAEVQRRYEKLHPDDRYDGIGYDLLADVIFEYQTGQKVDHTRLHDELIVETPYGKAYDRAYQAASALLDKHHP